MGAIGKAVSTVKTTSFITSRVAVITMGSLLAIGGAAAIVSRFRKDKDEVAEETTEEEKTEE